MNYPQRKKSTSKGKSTKTDAPLSESQKEEYQKLMKAKNKMESSIRGNSQMSLPDEANKRQSSLKHRTPSISSQKSSTRNNSMVGEGIDEFDSWYKDFANDKAQYSKSRLRSLIKPRRNSSMIHRSSQHSQYSQHSQHSIQSTTKRSKHPKNERVNTKYNDITSKLQQFRKDNPNLVNFINKYSTKNPQKVDEANVDPYQAIIMDIKQNLTDMNTKKIVFKLKISTKTQNIGVSSQKEL